MGSIKEEKDTQQRLQKEEIEDHKRHNLRVWSDLPKDLLALIFRRLPFTDGHRFASVCESWRLVALEKNHHIPCQPQPPLLVLPDHKTKKCNFFSVSEKKAYKIPLPELYGKWCVGSSLGWLATLDNKFNIILVNPISRLQVNLPPHPLFPDVQARMEGWRTSRYHCLGKVALSASPLSSECIVMAIVTDYHKLSFCKISDGQWIVLDSPSNYGDFWPVRDIIWYEGKIYATRELGAIVCEASSHLNVEKIRFPDENGDIGNTFHEKVIEIITSTRYLVESRGELLHIIRYVYVVEKTNERTMVNKFRDDGPLFKTRKFEVFKLENRATKRNMWTKVESLGDRSLLLGGNHSLSFVANDFAGWRANCIYFTDDYMEGCYRNIYGFQDMGVYSLDDQTFDKFYPDAPFLRSQAFWLTMNS